MAAGDVLKNLRSQGYRTEKPLESAGESRNDPDESNSTSRMVKLSEEEMKNLESYDIKPGEEVVFEVRGNLEGDHIHVMSVSYSQGKGPSEEQDMAKEVGMLVRPQIQPSPS